MNGPAQVHSIAAIERLRNSLARFEHLSTGALDGLNAELQRAIDWIEHDRPAYWKKQAQVAADEVHQAKLDLERCLMFPVADERPTCREERANLKKSQVRLEHCREKCEQVKHWNRQLKHELFEYEGRVGQLRRMLENQVPASRAKLQQIVQRLEEYQIERPPAQKGLFQVKTTEATKDETSANTNEPDGAR